MDLVEDRFGDLGIDLLDGRPIGPPRVTHVLTLLFF